MRTLGRIPWPDRRTCADTCGLRPGELTAEARVYAFGLGRRHGRRATELHVGLASSGSLALGLSLLVGWLGASLSRGDVPAPPVLLEREAPWRIASFAKDAGVLRRMVFDLAFETNGSVWFAASDGLYRYDGYHWRRFTGSHGLPSSFVRTVSVLRDGVLWVGTDKGAGVFDGSRFDRRGTEAKLAGPNVRRIVETSEGELWFCCDRWPDATSPGGLTRFRGGEFHTYGSADGLPSDHLLDLFEGSEGKLIALTAGGPAVRVGGGWAPLDEPGYPVGDHTWMMQEAREGLVFAQGFEATLVLKDGRWRPCPGGAAPEPAPICVTREGAVIKGVKTDRGTVAFARWDGETFVLASGEILDPGVDLHVMRQAPDGAIWAVGRGTILRWEYQAGSWDWRPELPPPVLEDRRQRLWFADSNGAASISGGQLQYHAEIGAPLVEDAQGAIWGAGGTGVVRWVEGQIETFPTKLSGIASLQGAVADRSSGVWFEGLGPEAESTLAGFHAGRWSVHGPDALGGLRVLSIAADPESGAWATLNDDRSSRYAVARVTTNAVRIVRIEGSEPRTHLPNLCVSRTHLYLLGYNGLWESPLGDSLAFAKIQPEAGGAFTQSASVGDIAVFVSQEGLDGNAAILARRPNGWLRQPVAYGEALWLSQEGWLMVADGAQFVLWQVREWNAPNYVNLPVDTTITAMLRTTDGEFWLRTYEGVLHLRPRTSLPDTALTGPANPREGRLHGARASGLDRFTPQSQSRRFAFAWRIDSSPWSDYGDWPGDGLPLPDLNYGPHVLEARARDGMGNEDPTPARLTFRLAPVPIQDRIWFRPALAAMGLSFGALSLALFGAIRRLRRHAGLLEQQVLARTAELRADIAERERAEASRRESEHLLRSIMDSTDSIVWVKDLKGRFVMVNRYLQELHGRSAEELLGRTVHELFPPDLAEAYTRNDRQVLDAGHRMEFDEVVRVSDGERTFLAVKFPLQDGAGHTYGLAAICTDITERQRAERERERLQSQLVQAQKMESVGRLAGGVAHDFNNMLQAILGNAALALQDLPPDSPLRESLEEIQRSAQRSANLTGQLLAFARKQTIRPKVLDLNDTVAGMLKMLRRLIGEDIQLCWAPGMNLWPVQVDPTQVDQILANLAVNARDAIAGAGRITITTANAAWGDARLIDHPDAVPGDYVLLEVSDTGHGMDEDTRAHLFEPFFTTKETGRGTGLGLATVFGIVKQNQGLIAVTSDSGRGSTFRIFLPRAQTEAVQAGSETAQPSPRGHETVLLVEDETQILNVGRRVLAQQGYTVLAAATPEAALALASADPRPIHLLITDVVMPGLNGKELYERLRSGRPDLKCLFMSGYTADVIAHHGVLDPGVHFLPKPFTLQTLASKVREVLAQPA